MTAQTLDVLAWLLAEPGAAGADICKGTSLSSGTVYPILSRLEEFGWVRSQWEASDPSSLGRPRKRFYTVTASGAAQARVAVGKYARLVARFAV